MPIDIREMIENTAQERSLLKGEIRKLREYQEKAEQNIQDMVDGIYTTMIEHDQLANGFVDVGDGRG